MCSVKSMCIIYRVFGERGKGKMSWQRRSEGLVEGKVWCGVRCGGFCEFGANVFGGVEEFL